MLTLPFFDIVWSVVVQSVHGYHGDEEDALADRLFAQHLIMERPELQRYGLNS